MKTTRLFLHYLKLFTFPVFAALLLAGCQSSPEKSASQPATPAAQAAPATPDASTVQAASAVQATPAAETKPVLPTIRIKAGVTDGFTDNSGNVWLPDQGFTDGETDERPEVTIVGASDQRIYQAERFSMTQFTQPLPNGNYTVKLHFCETYDGITGPGQRVFSFNVAGHEFKDFDIWVKAGNWLRPYIVTVPVEITNGKLDITFTPNIENPEINAIEIIPAQ
jgi:hypothetical protein